MKKDILVLGDSHAEVFGSASMADAFPDCTFEVIAVGGATVSGLPNPNAVTHARQRFQAALDATHSRTVIVMLGEVDTGFVIWYRSQKYSASVEAMTQQALRNYQELMLDIAGKFMAICISTPLPTIRDNTEWGEIANLRKEITATQRQRTALTTSFNRAMQAFCIRHNISYLMLDEGSMGADALVRDSLRNSDPSNHHYDDAQYAMLIAQQLRETFTTGSLSSE
jgi:hypothetical protein